MSRPRYSWWSYAKEMVRRYPRYCREWEELKTISATPNYGAVGHGSGISKPTEQVALRLLPASKQIEFDAVHDAIADVERQKNGCDVMRLIKMVYWKNSHTLAGAAMKIGIGADTAWQWHGDFIRLVGLHRGLMTREEWLVDKKKREEAKKKWAEKQKDTGQSHNSVL